MLEIPWQFQVICEIHPDSLEQHQNSVYASCLSLHPPAFPLPSLAILIMLKDLTFHWHPCLSWHLSFFSFSRFVCLQNSFSCRICSYTISLIKFSSTISRQPLQHMFLELALCKMVVGAEEGRAEIIYILTYQG